MRPNKDLIRKYLDGECSEEEQKEALKLLTNNETHDWFDEMADNAWMNSPWKEEPTEVNSERLYQNISKELQIDASRSNKNNSLRPWLYAACISILLICTFYFVRHETIPVAAPQDWIVKTMPAGMKSTILLSDGSKVILNSGSKISYAKAFTDSSRVIKLEGEAFFEVAKDKNRPFSVIANGTITTALGTSFNINAQDSVCKISLATGKVMITPPTHLNLKETYMLKSGEALAVNSNAKTAYKSVFDAQADLLWKDGILYFKETSVKQIIRRLELWYDVEFEVKGAGYIDEKYTGRFENASLSHVLDNMSYVLNFEYLVQGKRVIIIPREK